VTLDFALARLAAVVDRLVVYPEAMQRNLDRLGGLVHSQRVLLALVQAGTAREEAYAVVQRNAMKVWEEGADFLTELLADPQVRAALPEEQLREQFDLSYHTRHVDTIFERVFGTADARTSAPP
jgi:adenylosuccinate lyase